MQTTRQAQQGQARHPGLGVYAVRLLVLIACVAAFSLFVAPTSALAKSYSMPEVNIEATVNADGSLHVVEQRTFDFDGSFTCVWWEFNKLYSPKELQVNGVSLTFGMDSPGNVSTVSAPLEEVPFKKLWRSEGGPGFTSYSVDEAYDGVYVFFEASDTLMRVTLDYTVLNAVDVYTDCADLYWQFLGSDWAEDSQNVECVITLPAGASAGVAPVGVPASSAPMDASVLGAATSSASAGAAAGKTPAVEGDTVCAWGHGPLSGKVQFSEDATQISYSVPRVRSGEFAEARIVFPTDWLNLPAGYETKNRAGLESILESEQAEADKANRSRIVDLVFFGVLGLASLISVLWAAINWLLYGREYRPKFTEKYWRDLPNKNVHPAAINRLMNWNKSSSMDVVATILHLADEGAISINQGPRIKNDGTWLSSDDDYYLTFNKEVSQNLTSPVDTELIKLLFGDIAKNRNSVWMSEIEAWGDKHKASFNGKLSKWHKKLDSEVRMLDYFEAKGESKQESASIAAMLLLFVGIFLSFELENWWPVIIFAVGALVVFLFSVFMPRRSRQGAEDYARAKALKRWLKDFTLLNESIPTDVKVWGHFMVYAFMFGVAAKTLKQLRGVVPEMFAEGQGLGTGDGGGLPWRYWYVSDGIGSSAKGSFADTFDRMWSNTATSAAVAVSSSSGGGWSSGGGFSGGFSGGGGGGFGGGGGGAR